MGVEGERIISSELCCQLDLLVESIVGYLPCKVRRIVLFGSYQRGEAKPESDIDIAVLIDEDAHWQRRLDEETTGKYTHQDKIRDTNRILFKQFIDNAFPQNKFSIVILTPQDLEGRGQFTDLKPRGNVALNIIQGRTLFVDPDPGWWQDGQGLNLTFQDRT